MPTIRLTRKQALMAATPPAPVLNPPQSLLRPPHDPRQVYSSDIVEVVLTVAPSTAGVTVLVLNSTGAAAFRACSRPDASSAYLFSTTNPCIEETLFRWPLAAMPSAGCAAQQIGPDDVTYMCAPVYFGPAVTTVRRAPVATGLLDDCLIRSPRIPGDGQFVEHKVLVLRTVLSDWALVLLMVTLRLPQGYYWLLLPDSAVTIRDVVSSRNGAVDTSLGSSTITAPDPSATVYGSLQASPCDGRL
jgi:hypothetical protein